MNDLSLYQDVKAGGGRARDNGSFHLSFRSGSRATGTCAAQAFDYIAREGRFEDDDLDRAVCMKSGNMPSWAEADPRESWDAADLHERRTGGLFVGGDFTLPRGLDIKD